MQALYGYYTARESLVDVVRDELRVRFTPDALIHDLSDTTELDEHRKLALQAYDEAMAQGVRTVNIPDAELKSRVEDYIQKYYDLVRTDAKNIRKFMLDGTRRLMDDYYLFLLLAGEFQHIEKLDQEKKERALVKKESSYRFNFIHNPFINSLTTLPALQKAATERKLSWQQDISTLRAWYRDIIQADATIQAYQQLEEPTDKEHQDAVIYLYKKVFFKHETCTDFWSDRDVRWAENGPILSGMVIKTLQSYEPDLDEPFELKTLSLNEEDDFEFFQDLYDQTLRQDDYFEKLIAERTKNWDVTRLAMTDKIILKMALAEMIHCISIPVKVSINEYIELCKTYSTPKSKQFVNGILDVLANQLTSEGVIKKSGRGLIDNR
jgi:transcription antitermination protein NusB